MKCPLTYKNFYIFFFFLSSFKIFAVNIKTPHSISQNESYVEDETKFSKVLSPAEKIRLENQKAQALASFAKMLNIVTTQYVDAEAVNLDKLVEKAFQAMISDLDPHSGYLTADQFKKFVSVDPKKSTASKSVELMDLSHKIAYLKLRVFNSTAYQDVYTLVSNYQKEHYNKITGMILDLRDNPGGLFDQSVYISNLFVSSGILVSTIGRDKAKPQDVQYALKQNTFDDFPMIVLVNENTASSSEILAGALQDRDRALIMGSKTYGKGSVQKVVPLPNGGAVKFTVARYYTPSGRSLQSEGVIPDIMFMPRGESKFKNKLKNKPLQIAAQNKSVYQEFEEWDASLKEDNEIKQAYLYLRQSL